MRTPLVLYAVGLVARGFVIGTFPDPAYPDSFYYVDVARSIAAGHGFTVDFIWIFAEVGNRIPANAVLPVPSNGHWLPLASLVQVPFIVVLGPTALASALPLALIGALAAPLTWLIAKDAGLRPAVATGAALLSAAPGASAVFMAQPENAAILQPLVAACVWLAARGLKGSGRAFALAGLLAGLAALSRNDGILLAAALGLIWLADRIRWLRRRARARSWSVGFVRPPIAAWGGLAAGMLFLLVIGPWWARQIAVFGSISPTASSGAALWIRSIDEWNSITSQPSLDRFLAQGAGPILASRLTGLGQALVIFAVIGTSVALLPFLLLGIAARWRSLDFVPWLVYAVVVFLGAALLYPAHVPGGAFFHAAVGLLPHAAILSVEGVALFAAWLASRRRASGPARPEIPVRMFTSAAVVFGWATAVVYGASVEAHWDAVRQPRMALAAALDRLAVPVSDRILSIDAAGIRYWTGHPGIVTPNDPLDTIEAVAQAYGIRWLVLERGETDRDGPVPALRPVLEATARPAWIGPRAFAVPSADGGLPALVLHPVCSAASDARCSP